MAANTGSLSTRAKIAIGVMIPLITIILAVFIFALLRRRRRKNQPSTSELEIDTTYIDEKQLHTTAQGTSAPTELDIVGKKPKNQQYGGQGEEPVELSAASHQGAALLDPYSREHVHELPGAVPAELDSMHRYARTPSPLPQGTISTPAGSASSPTIRIIDES